VYRRIYKGADEEYQGDIQMAKNDDQVTVSATKNRYKRVRKRVTLSPGE
jgi:hypothetical protein